MFPAFRPDWASQKSTEFLRSQSAPFSWFDRRSCTTSALGACLYGSMAEDTGPETAAAFSCAPRDGEADR